MLEFFGQYGPHARGRQPDPLRPSALDALPGLKALGVGEKLISAGMVAIVCILIGATLMHDDARLAHLWQSQWQYVVPVFNLAVLRVRRAVPGSGAGARQPGNPRACRA